MVPPVPQSAWRFLALAPHPWLRAAVLAVVVLLYRGKAEAASGEANATHIDSKQSLVTCSRNCCQAAGWSSLDGRSVEPFAMASCRTGNDSVPLRPYTFFMCPLTGELAASFTLMSCHESGEVDTLFKSCLRNGENSFSGEVATDLCTGVQLVWVPTPGLLDKVDPSPYS